MMSYKPRLSAPSNLVQSAKITVLTAIKPDRLTKSFSLNKDETIIKQPGGVLVEGQANIIEIESLHSFANLLQGLDTNQALTYGLPVKSPIKIVSKKQYQIDVCPDDCLPRTSETFEWPTNAGILMLDHDPVVGRESHDRNSLLKLLSTLFPETAAAGSIWWPSSSSCLYNGVEKLTGIKGQRLYFLVTDASDIPRAGKVLIDRLWLNGHGFYEISRSGQSLERTLFDGSVWQPSRLDFAAGARCISPIEQRRGEPATTDGDLLDTRAVFVDLTDVEQAELKAIKDNARLAIRSEIEAKKQQYIGKRVAEITTNVGDENNTISVAETIKRAVEHSVLCGNFPLMLDDGVTVSVGQVLDDPSTYHARLCFDPLEPEYGDNKVVGRLYLMGSHQNLYSFAHGGRNYTLIRQPRRIDYSFGRQYEAREQTLSLMREVPDLYDLGAQLVTISEGKTIALDRSKLQRWLGGNVEYYREKVTKKETSEIPLDVPLCDAIHFIELGETRRLKPLKAVISAPICLPGGRLITQPGYDERSQLYFDSRAMVPPISDTPTELDARRALIDAFEPFNRFPFASGLDRSVLLSAILTAVVRPALSTAPAFGFDAPVQGSGKTLLAKALSMLSTGEAGTVWPHISGNEEEVRKRLLTLLRDGSRAIVWDNVNGFFDSTSIAALITSETMTDRVLGSSQHLTLPNRCLFMITGNNLTMAGDMPRRVLKCRIDPRTEQPHARQFDIDPEAYVKQHRFKIVGAALTLLRAWFSSQDYLSGERAPGRLASFEEWDDTVRQTVAWLSRHVDKSLVDPMEAINLANADDPEQTSLCELLQAIHKQFRELPFTAKELRQAAKNVFASELQEAIEDMANGMPSTKSLGRHLSSREDRVVNGLALRALSLRSNTKRWQIECNTTSVTTC